MKSILASTGRLTALFIMIFLFSGTAQSTIIYVNQDASGLNNGSSWTNAYTDLSVAIQNSTAGDQIWVAEGDYYPGQSREDAFSLSPGVAIYGGFNGLELNLDERDYLNNETVLNGDIGIPGEVSDNSYHVLNVSDGSQLDSTTVLDGFTVSNGNANGDLNQSLGGGIFHSDGTPLYRNCLIISNSANAGGGAHVGGGAPYFIDVIFQDNYASLGGGAVDNFGVPAVYIRCTFDSNIAESYGGAMSIDLASPIIYNSIFLNNSADYGGAISNYTHSEPVFTNCTIVNNEAPDGGAAMWNGMAFPQIANSIIWGNTPDKLLGDASIVTYSNIAGGFEGQGNMESDPVFVDLESGNLHLMQNSPCIDAGNPDPEYYDNCLPPGLNEALNDMGAYGGAYNCWEEPDQQVSEVPKRDQLPSNIKIKSIYPNPFNTQTTISFSLRQNSSISIKIYNLNGQLLREIRNQRYESGSHKVTWKADLNTGLASGIFWLIVKTDNESAIEKLVYLK